MQHIYIYICIPINIITSISTTIIISISSAVIVSSTSTSILVIELRLLAIAARLSAEAVASKVSLCPSPLFGRYKSLFVYLFYLCGIYCLCIYAIYSCVAMSIIIYASREFTKGGLVKGGLAIRYVFNLRVEDIT